MRKLLILFVLVACVPAQAIKQCEVEQLVAQQHQANDALPVEARLLAEDNEDAWAAQNYILNGTRLSPAVETRLTEAGRLPEGYAK